MKSRNNVFSILLIILLSLTLLTACQAKAPLTPAENSTETADEKKTQQQLQDGQKETEEASRQGQPATDAPKATPAEASAESKTAKETQNDAKGSSAPKQDDKTCLQVEGAGIEKTVTLSLDDLKAMKDAYFEDDFFSLNSYGTKEYFHFKGVKLKSVLEKAGLKKSAAAITFIASDGYKQELTLEQALREDYMDEQNSGKKYPVIIAWHENGEDYDAEKDAPFRLVIGQKEPGDVNKPQWVQNIAKIIVD